MAETHRTIASVVLDRERWSRFADSVAVALVVALPWSTSATGILAAILIVAIIPNLDRASLRRVLSTPAGGLPVLLCLVALAGMLWASGVPLAERSEGLKSFLKLLVIPLLMIQFRRSGNGRWVVSGFLASCGVLLALSWLLTFVPGFPWPWHGKGQIGVPIKDYISQSGEFIVCAAILAWLGLKAWREQRRGIAITIAFAIVALLANILTIATSRTALVVIPVLLVLFAYKHLSGKAITAFLAVGIVAGALALVFVTPTRENVAAMFTEVQTFDPGSGETRAGARLEFWKKSVGFILEAPFVGHGTGSIRDQFRRSVRGTGMAAVASSNPHNQTFAVAIQLGLLGAAVMFAMWMAHALLFRGTGFVAWVGLVIVTQNVVGSLFNSHLFDFLQGWGYVIGVGVAAGMILRQGDLKVASRD